MLLSRSSKPFVDPLSAVLSVLGPRSVRRTRLEASGSWALSFSGRSRLKFVALLRGRCWIVLPQQPPQLLEGGDVFLICDTSYTVASDPQVEPTDGLPLYAGPGEDVVELGTGRETVMLGGGISFDDAAAGFVLEALPPFLRIEGGTSAAKAVGRALALLEAEVQEDRPGSALVASRLADILLVEALRTFIASSNGKTASWIAALADPKIGHALRLMHDDPAHPWTLNALARQIGMSRSAFTSRFLEHVGQPPLAYLTRWRMVLARRRLSEGDGPVAQVASEVGYASQSAFAHAFKRTFGYSPRSITGAAPPLLGHREDKAVQA